MPEIGGKKLAGDFADMMKDIRKAMDEAKGMVGDAVRELKTEITTGAKTAAKAIRQEAATVREGFSVVAGNSPPDEEEAADPEPPTPPPAPLPVIDLKSPPGLDNLPLSTNSKAPLPKAPQLTNIHRDTGDPVR